MIKLDKKPSEEVYQIMLVGKFAPQKFHPLWFAEKKLLGKKEAKNAEVITIDENEATFTTEFLRIIVEESYFRIIPKQLVFWNVAKEFAVNVSKILEQTLDDFFFIGSSFHFTFNSEKKMMRVLNNFNQNHKVWAGILENPQLDEMEISETINIKHGWIQRNVSLSKCGRDDMENTIHLYVTGMSVVNLDEISVSNAILENENALNGNLVVVNKIINAYF